MATFNFEILPSDELKQENERRTILNSKIEKFKCGDVIVLSSTENKEKLKDEAIFNLVLITTDLNKNEIDGVGKHVCALAKAPNNSHCIPVAVSKALFEQTHNLDFLKAYLDIYKKEFKPFKNTFKGVELDFAIHSKCLPLPVDNVDENEARLFYFFMDPTDSTKEKPDFYVWIKSLDGEKEFFKLDELEDLELEDDQKHVDNTEELRKQITDFNFDENFERDPEIEEFNKKFKNIYENKFRTFLKSLSKNETIYATTLPTKKYCKETFDEDSMNSTTLVFYFDKLDLDENGNINAVVVKTFDKTETCHFHPFLCNHYGPYYKTTLLCTLYNVGRGKESSAQSFFLDLPVGLYNEIDED
jgi:hypothetical protein